MSLAALEQIGRLNSKGVGYPGKHLDARISFPALDAASVGQIDLSLVRQLLLSQFCALACASHVRSNNGAPVNHSVEGTLPDTQF